MRMRSAAATHAGHMRFVVGCCDALFCSSCKPLSVVSLWLFATFTPRVRVFVYVYLFYSYIDRVVLEVR